MVTTLSICLEDFLGRHPSGVVLTNDKDGKVLDSEYCDTVEDYVEFARKHKDRIDEDTLINIVMNIDDIESTAVLDFGSEVAKEIKKAIME